MFAFVIAIAALSASLDGVATDGVDFGGATVGGRVASVAPTGYAWLDGIRPGQLIVAEDYSDAPTGFRLVTSDAGRQFVTEAVSRDRGLRQTLVLSLGAVLVAALAVLLLRGRRSWVPAFASASLLLAVTPLTMQDAPASMAAIGGAAAVPVAWLAWRPRVPRAIGIGVTAVVVAILAWWIAMRIDGDPTLLRVQPLLGAVGLWAMVLVVAGSIVLPGLRGEPIRPARPRLGDVALLCLGAGLVYVGVTGYIVPLPVAALIGVAILAGVPVWRRRVADRAERILLADLRERAVIDASEAERAHLARELHDAPLQHLAATIRRLEAIPEARAEAEELRLVADQLRGLATELRPPVLDDLGLAAAIEFLGDAMGGGDLDVLVEVEDGTGFVTTGRPPGEVELALFRIVQEALGNAARHADASSVRVRGSVHPTRIELYVEDDGRGIDDDAARTAARRGRLGLASMRRRAEAVDADLTITRADPGTRVAVRWQA
jgi:signal transduction histidine kinase